MSGVASRKETAAIASTAQEMPSSPGSYVLVDRPGDSAPVVFTRQFLELRRAHNADRPTARQQALITDAVAAGIPEPVNRLYVPECERAHAHTH